MDRRILELALETLEKQKADVEKEIAELRGGNHRSQQVVGKKRAHKSKSATMLTYWERKRAESSSTGTSAKAASKRRPKSPAERKALSKKMKAVWAKRKAESAQRAK